MATQSLVDKLQMEVDAELVATSDPTEAHPEAHKVGGVIHRPTADAPLPVGLSEHTGLYVNLWNTRTHEKISVLKWYATAALKKTHNDPAFPEWVGRRLFSTKSTGERVLGQHKCMLHRDHPVRIKYGTDGMPVCPAEHLASEHEVRSHMQHRHKKEWEALERARADFERLEDRTALRAQSDAMLVLAREMTGATAVPATVAAPSAAAVAAEAPTVKKPRVFKKKCDACDQVVTAQSGFGLQSAIKKHQQETHASV